MSFFSADGSRGSGQFADGRADVEARVRVTRLHADVRRRRQTADDWAAFAEGLLAIARAIGRPVVCSMMRPGMMPGTWPGTGVSRGDRAA